MLWPLHLMKGMFELSPTQSGLAVVVAVAAVHHPLPILLRIYPGPPTATTQKKKRKYIFQLKNVFIPSAASNRSQIGVLQGKIKPLKRIPGPAIKMW